jgi:hypothetical protein
VHSEDRRKSEGRGPRATTASPAPQQEAATIDAVRRALRDIEYGSVLITIHQGEVVGIETSTKVRLKGS